MRAGSGASAGTGRRPTIRDVGRRAGVSVGTVSHVMNGTAKVTPDKVQRVREAIEELHYRPSHAASSLVRSRTATVAFSYVASRLEGDLFKVAEMISLASGLSRHGLALLLAPEADTGVAGGPSAVGRFALERRVDGVILTDVDLEPTRVTELRGLGLPCVIYGSPPDAPLDAVDVDDRYGIAMAVDHLRSLGHSAIVFLSAPLHEDYARERLGAYLERMEVHRLAPTVIQAEGYRVLDGQAAVLRHGALGGLTALIGATDQLALGALQAVGQLGLRVPADLSVVGFDDIPMAESVLPGLTTIRQPIDRMSDALVGCLIAAMGREGPGAEGRRPAQLIAPELVVRGTTAPARGAGADADKGQP